MPEPASPAHSLSNMVKLENKSIEMSSDLYDNEHTNSSKEIRLVCKPSLQDSNTLDLGSTPSYAVEKSDENSKVPEDLQQVMSTLLVEFPNSDSVETQESKSMKIR